ncbi:unnamed protein product, partial [Amoebophrya sp. A120]
FCNDPTFICIKHDSQKSPKNHLFLSEYLVLFTTTTKLLSKACLIVSVSTLFFSLQEITCYSLQHLFYK